jgi:hypothetical protein
MTDLRSATLQRGNELGRAELMPQLVRREAAPHDGLDRDAAQLRTDGTRGPGPSLGRFG